MRVNENFSVGRGGGVKHPGRELWNLLQAVFTGIGGWLGYFLGGCDGLMYALIAFTVIDYISGVVCGIVDKRLSSSVGWMLT